MMHQVLKAGQSMIGLQYGTNKGASQVSCFSEYSTKREIKMKTHTGKYFFSEYATEKKTSFSTFQAGMTPYGASRQIRPEGEFIQHLSSSFNTKLHCSRFWSGIIFHHIVIIFWHPNTPSKLFDWTSINQTTCSCQWKKSYCGLLRSNEDTAACFAIVCFFVGTSQAFAGHSALKDALAATLAGAYLPHSASKRS